MSVKKLKMLSFVQRQWFLLSFLVCLSFGLDSCKNRTRDKAKSQQETENNCQTDTFSVDFTELERLNPALLNTLDYFIGEIDGEPHILKLTSASKNKIQGKCYPIDASTNTSHPVVFTLRSADSAYVLTYGKETASVRFSLHIDTVSLSGSVTSLGDQAREHRIAFKRHRSPAYSVATSSCYLEPQFTFTRVPDIHYGKVKGFWTSYPMEGDTNYAKMIFKLLPNTMIPKKLDLSMDLYLPNDSTHNHPLFVLLHGGAFFFGDKGERNMRGWCEHFAQCGYAVASVNYRMGFAITKSSIQQCGYQAVQDAHAALRYLVAHAEEYRIDPDYIFLAGTSAGSITALAAAFMTDNNCPPYVAKHKLVKKCGRLHTSGNDYRNEVKIKAVANMWGALYDLHELDGCHIPVVSFHGTADKIVPFDYGYPFSGIKGKIGEMMFDEMFGSQSIHRYLDSLHVRNRLYPLEGCGHAPHQEKNGTLNKHYLFIQGKMLDFFYPELKTKSKLENDGRYPQVYCIADAGVTCSSWQAEGGLILEIAGNSVRVIWFDDQPKHLLRTSGFNALGVPFSQEWSPMKACS
jgi:pimeloyl-ACP methyl ester carboxylesterase